MRSRSVGPFVPLLSALAAGCATVGSGGGGTVSGRFPLPTELARIEVQPAPTRIFHEDGRAIDQWELEGPLPARVELTPHRGEGPWQRALDEQAAARPGLVYLSERMHCVARETGRFGLAHGAMPDHALDQFLRGRCGAVTGPGTSAWLSGDISGEVTEAQIAERFAPQVRKMLADRLGAGTLDAGIWFGKSDKKALVVVSWERRLAQLDPVGFQPGLDGTFRMTGETLQPAATLEALVTRGRYGHADCVVDPKVRLPRFAIDCPVAPGDPTATVEVLAFPAGRILGSAIITLILWPSGEPAKTFQRTPYTITADAGAAATDPLLVAINQAREAAGLVALVPAPAESATAARVAPHYFAATSGFESETVADTVALGLMAGWQVEGLVRRGRFTAGFCADAARPAALVINALERPSSRRTLLDPEARRIAIGPVAAGKSLAAVISTYSLFESSDHSAGELSVLKRLTVERTKAGGGPTTKVVQLCRYAHDALARVGRGKEQPGEAAHSALQAMHDDTNRGGQAFVIESESLDQIRFPDGLLNAHAAEVGIAISHYKPEGKPWGRYIVLLVMAAPLDSI